MKKIETNSIKFSVNLAPKIVEKIKKLAKKNKLSMSEVVRAIIVSQLN